MRYTTLFFDLDDTLYPSSTGLWNAIRDRMSQFMHERLGLSWEEIPELRRGYYLRYGTTLRGLQIHHEVDADDYLAYVHDLPLEEYLQPRPQVREMLRSLPQNLWVFTNSDSNHVQRVLRVLGLSDCFAGVIDVRALNFLCKPEVGAYRQAMRLAGESEPEHCLFLDDSPANLAPAKDLGLTTVLVGARQPHPAADYCLQDVLELPDILKKVGEDGHGRQAEGSRSQRPDGRGNGDH
jgi:putative hydrolase of the HAD superfamily